MMFGDNNEDNLTQRNIIFREIIERDKKNKEKQKNTNAHLEEVTMLMSDFSSLFSEIADEKFGDDEIKRNHYFRNNGMNIAPGRIYTSDMITRGEYHKEGDIYRPVDYTDQLFDLQKMGEKYIKLPEIQHNYFDFLFINTHCYLFAQMARNINGFKLSSPLNGWRYNFWNMITGNYLLSLFLGYLTSGFVLFPLLIYLSSILDFVPGKMIAVFLLFVKIIREVWYWFKNNVFKIRFRPKEVFLNLVDILDYLNFGVVEPLRLQNMMGKVEFPPYISIIISRLIKDNPELFDTRNLDLAKVYKWQE